MSSTEILWLRVIAFLGLEGCVAGKGRLKQIGTNFVVHLFQKESSLNRLQIASESHRRLLVNRLDIGGDGVGTGCSDSRPFFTVAPRTPQPSERVAGPNRAWRQRDGRVSPGPVSHGRFK